MPTTQFKVVCFDLDGTLLQGTTVSLLMAERLGHVQLMQELEERYRRHEISNSVGADITAREYAGLTKADVWQHLKGASWIQGMRPAISELKKCGLHVLLCTVTWKFAAELLQEHYAFDAACGTVMEQRDGKLTGKVLQYFDEHDKLSFVRNYCTANGFDLRDCVAIGDSRSDIPLFRSVGLAIALNATPEARAAAHISIDTEDLRTVLQPIFASRTKQEVVGHDYM